MNDKKIKWFVIMYADGSWKGYNKNAFLKVLRMHTSKLMAWKQLEDAESFGKPD